MHASHVTYILTVVILSKNDFNEWSTCLAYAIE